MVKAEKENPEDVTMGKNSEVENWLKVIFFSQSIENNGPETNNGHMGYCGHLLCKEIKGE